MSKKDYRVAELLYAVSQGDEESVKLFIKAGIAINSADYDKRTAAHIAAAEGDVNMLRLLEKGGADFSAKDRWGGTPMDDAILENRAEAREFLGERGIKRGAKEKMSHPDGLEKDPEQEDIVIQPNSNVSKLLHAAAQGRVEEVEKLVASCDINSTDYDMRTAMHVAASEGQQNVVEFLIGQDALINVRDRWGHSPVDDAVRGNYSDLVTLLQSHGGEATAAYANEKIAEDLAGDDERMRKLQKKGVRERWAISGHEIIKDDKPFARGAGGELYRARWRGLEVVVKSCENMISNQQALLDLANEISLLSTLRHPNLIMFLGATFETFPPLLMLEYAAGGTLEERIISATRDGHAVHKREKVKYTYELALAMNFLHLCNPPVVHRDLKPSNILLTKDLNLRVTDFGLSKFIPAKNRKLGDKFQMTGETGSYRFMATEVFMHEQYNEKVDVYSFALITYWMQTGLRPFRNIPNPVEAVKAAVNGERPTFAQSFPKKMQDLLSDCWGGVPDERPSFAEIINRLDEMGYGSFSLREGKNCAVC